MKNWKFPPTMRHDTRKVLNAWGVTAALCLCVYGATGIGIASAQATSGRIFGHVPAGQTVTAHSTTGLRRHVTVKSGGRYTITSLPAGAYAVTLETDGAAVDTRNNIPLAASRGTEVNFACPQNKCEAR